MSVIQEALRRKMAEQAERRGQAQAGEQPPAATSYPTASPDARQNAASETPRPASPPSTYPESRNPVVARTGPAERPMSWFVLLFLFLLAGGAALLFFVQSRETGGAVTVSVPQPSHDTGQPVLPRSSSQPMDAEESELVAVETVAESQPEDDMANPEPSRAVAAKQDTVTRDDWPKVELMGILAGGEDERSTAILNGALVMLNAEIDGVTLADVGEDGVYLEFRGDRQYIRIGEFTR